jgi:hypothetical protein
MGITEEERKRLAAKIGLRDGATPSLEEELFGQAAVVSPPQDQMSRDLITNAKADAPTVEAKPPAPAKTTEVSPTTNTTTAKAPSTNTTVKAGTSTPSIGITPASILASGLAANQAEEDAITKARDDISGEMAQEKAERQKQSEKLTADIDAYTRDAEEAMSRRANTLTQIDTEQSELNRLTQAQENSKVDPSRWFNNASTASKIGLAISAALHVAGQAFKGAAGRPTDNGFLDVVNKFIDRDIEEQKIQMAKFGDLATKKGVLLARLKEQYGDDARAVMTARTMAYNAADTIIKNKMANTQNARELGVLGQQRAALAGKNVEQQQQYFANKSRAEEAAFNQNLATAQLGLEAAKIEASRAPMYRQGDETIEEIHTLRPEDQKAALKEYQDVKTDQARNGTLYRALDVVEKAGIGDYIDFTKYDAARAVLRLEFQRYIKGVPSDKDTAVLEDLLSKRWMSREQAQEVTNQVKDFISANMPKTPVLDGYGIKVKPWAAPKTFGKIDR